MLEDSGGPLMIADKPGGDITAGSPRFDLIIGVTFASPDDCDSSVPGLYTRVSDFSEWITNVLNGTLQVMTTASCLSTYGMNFRRVLARTLSTWRQIQTIASEPPSMTQTVPITILMPALPPGVG